MSHALTTCLCCGGDDLLGYLDLGRRPLAHAYHRGEALARYPLQLALCARCCHTQLSAAVDDAARARNDLFVCGTTAAARAHLRGLARDALAWTGARRVLDVACGDGALLEELAVLGCDGVGADRSPALRELARAKGLRVLDAPWGAAALDELHAACDGPFELILARDVLARVADPLACLRACADALAPGGAVVVEVPYAARLRPRDDLDLPHHEQVSYFLARSLAVLVKRAGLQLDDVQRTGSAGGALRLVLREADGLPAHCAPAYALMDQERDRGLHDPRTYDGLHARVEERGRALVALLEAARRRGGRAVGLGTCAAGNVLLDRFELGLDCVVDDDPLKWGHRVPGRDTPIRPPRALAEEPAPLAILLPAGASFDAARRKVLAFRGDRREDTFVLCAPSLREVPTWAPAVLVEPEGAAS